MEIVWYNYMLLTQTNRLYNKEENAINNVTVVYIGALKSYLRYINKVSQLVQFIGQVYYTDASY